MSDVNGSTHAPNGKDAARGRLKTLIDKVMRRRSGDFLEDVTDALDSRGERGDAMDPAHRTMVIAAARFNDKLRAGEVMTPRADIVALEASATLGEAARLFAESQHSRIPIYRETLDDPIGFVHVKDVLALLAPNDEGVVTAKFTDRVLSRLRREMLFVPPSMPLPTLLVKMRSQQVHLALVIDEYGGTDGLITIEDIVEQIVGDIEDEHDIRNAAQRVEIAPGGFIEAEGRAPVELVEAKLGASLTLPEHEDDVETIGGLAVAIAARVPQRGEVLRHPAGYDLEVMDADPRRVKLLRIRSVAAELAPPEAAE